MSEPLINGLFALAGVLLGACLSYFVAAWKNASDFRVSCRLIEHELDRNIAFLSVVSADPRTASERDIADELWRGCQLNLALFLPEVEWNFLARHYALVPHLQAELDRAKTMSPDELIGLKKAVDQVISEMNNYRDIVAEFKTRSLPRGFIHALRGRAAPAKATRKAN